MRLSSLCLVAALFPFAVACGGAPEGGEALGTQASAVQGGSVDTNTQNNFAVGIASTQGAVCSGTLIAPNLVLTARHCVVAADGNAAVSCNDKFGRTVPASALYITTSPRIGRSSTFYPAKKIIVPAATGFCGNDIALVILDELIPESDAKPATPVVQFEMTDPKIGEEIVALGYGITAPNASDSGQRRIRENIGILCVPGSKTLACTGQLAQFSDSDAEFITEGYVCSGDSGGGAFDQKSFASGSPYVLGALSRGPQTEDRCLAAIYSRTDKHATMIIDAGLEAAEAGGYEAPAWTKPLNVEPEPAAPPVGATECEGDTCTDVAATEPEPTTVVKKTTTSGCAAAPGARGDMATALLGLGAVALVLGRRARRSRSA